MKKENNKKSEKPKIGSFNAIKDLVSEAFKFRKNMPKKAIKSKEEKQKQMLAIVLAIIIVTVFCLAMWFIPFTNGIIKKLLYI